MVIKMDPKWVQAVNEGDVEFWRKTISEYKTEIEAALEANNGQPDYQYDYSNNRFLSKHRENGRDRGNILHIAAMEGGENIFKEVIQSLPEQLVQLMLTQHDYYKDNPLHIAARNGHQGIVKLIIEFYENLNTELKLEAKPWLAQNASQATPLHSAMHWKKEECAFEIVKARIVDKDLEKLCNIVANDGQTLLYLAISRAYSRIALHILRMAPSYSFGDKKGHILYHGRHCSEEVWELLLENHPDLMIEVDDNGENIFHKFAEAKEFQVCTKFADMYKQLRSKELASFEREANQIQNLPWLATNKSGVSPLEIAMADNRTASDEYKRLKTDLLFMDSAVKGDCELLFVAIRKGLYHAAEAIWYVQNTYGFGVYLPHGRQFWNAALMFSEKAALWVAEKLPSLTSEPDEIKYVLNSASVNGAAGFIEWILKKDPSALELAPTVWIDACERGHFSTVKAFIDNCPYFREICIEQNDTPLHYIKFKGYRQYLDFLKDPIVLALKNFQDLNGETPLHKSIKTRNLLLTEVLLTTDDVIRSIEDNEHNTAMDLMVKACRGNRKWKEMCKRNGILPGLKTTYFQDKTNLLDARNALLVVAALVATITFTAGFTLPGGVQSDSSGKPILGNKAAFLVFLLADVVAMCSSMLVLVCLLWSMLCDHNKSLYLIDKSMPALLVSLCSTLLAFMTGVYVVIPRKSLWASILILVVCSIVIVSSIPWIMNKIIARLNLEREEEYIDEIELMEQGEATNLLGHRSSKIQERASSSIGVSNPRHATELT